MTESEKYSRRNFIRKYAGAMTLMSGGLLGVSCSQKKSEDEKSSSDGAVASCDDLSGLSESDIALRQKLGYVNESPIEESRCNNCNLYLPPGEGKKCGGCMLFKGPVFPEAYCTYWAPRVEEM